MIKDLLKIYERDLDRLIQEIDAFQQEHNLWKTTGSITNSAGNLCLHLIGNLNTFIGRNIGNTNYVRDRPAEFSLKNIPKQQLIEQLRETKEVVLTILSQLDSTKLLEKHPEQVFREHMTNGFFLIHLASHLSYHLGQINYLRRVLE